MSNSIVLLNLGINDNYLYFVLNPKSLERPSNATSLHNVKFLIHICMYPPNYLLPSP